MSSRHAHPSAQSAATNGAAGPSAPSAAAAGAAEPVTPARRVRKSKQMSHKRFEKLVKDLSSVQRSNRKAGHYRLTSGDPATEPGSSSSGARAADSDPAAGVGEQAVPYAIGEEAEDGLAAALAAVNVEGAQANTEYWLRTVRDADTSGLAKLAGKGPDGIALARTAAKGLKGKANAPQDSFMHEASFVFNPLTRRVPHASPRKAAAAPSGRREKGKSKEPAASAAAQAAVREGAPVGAGTDESELLPLGLASKEVQEALILEDLLFVLMGIEGSYITYAPSYAPDDPAARLRGAQWVVDPALDPSLRDLVERILPLATHYSSIFAFVEMDSSLEFGTVMHALCSAIRELLKEYEILLVQLEHQHATSPGFTLQRFFFYIHPTMRTLSIVHSLTSSIANVSHAPLLADDDDTASLSSSSDEDDDEVSGTLEQEQRAILGLDDDDSADEVKGGIVKGGEVLAILWERCERMRGDATASALFSTLFLRASQPYARILLRWITTGHLSDTYDEFMIAEDPRVTVASLEQDPTDEYWDRRYMLRDDMVREQREQRQQRGLDFDFEEEDLGPRGFLTGGAKIPGFLEPWKQKILLAGKYLNVVRECGKDIGREDGADAANLDDAARAQGRDGQLVSMTDDSFFARIDEAYERANSALLRLLLVDHNIMERLRSMRHYFFQAQGDFFSIFLVNAEHELRKRVNPSHIREATTARLQSILGMVLGSSSCVGSDDPYREDVRIDFAGENAYEQMRRIAETKGGVEAARAQARRERQRDVDLISVMELLQFDLAVHFPVSLVISKRNILRWQFLQRPIIHLKATERALAEVWHEHRSFDLWRARHSAPLERYKLRVFALRSRIGCFVQQVLAFITVDVLERNWRELEEKMGSAKTVDQFMRDHFDFLNTCRKECMLTNVNFVDVLGKLMSVASVFTQNAVRFRDSLKNEVQRAEAHRAANPLDAALEVDEKVLAFLERIEEVFDRRIRMFRDIVSLEATTENPAAVPLQYALVNALQ